jgi:peptide-methionine (R)-S-oxide reductase
MILASTSHRSVRVEYRNMTESEETQRDSEQWREVLTYEEYRVLRERGTEPRFIGEYLYTPAHGLYPCSGCVAALFYSHP